MILRDNLILITGASSGLGAAFASRFAAEGANLVLVARRQDRLEDLAQRLRDEHGVQMHSIVADLAAAGSGRTLARTVSERGLVPSMIVNNAGVGATGPFVETDERTIADQLAVNIDALVGLTAAFLPAMVTRGSGTILNVASMSGHQPAPNMAIYGATKAFVLSFTEAIAAETRDSGVTVLALSPGPTRTGFYETAGTDEGSTRFQTPEQVVDTAMSALQARHTPASIVSGRANRAQLALTRFLPRGVVLSMVSRAYRPRKHSS